MNVTMPFGVSNSFKRGTMRTYGSRTSRSLMNSSAERPHVRIRMDENGFATTEDLSQDTSTTIPQPTITTTATNDSAAIKAASVDCTEASSPSSRASRTLFSETEHHTSATPPSSPPLRRASPQLQTRKPAFNYLKRKRSAAAENDVEPLSETNANSTPRRQPPAKRTRLTQMRIDLGGDVRKTCKDCGMEYVPSNREDATLHKEFHDMNVRGVEMGTGFAKESDIVERWGFGEVVSMISHRSKPALRRRTKRVLDVVRADLGALEISEETLWGKDEKTKSKTKKESEQQEERPDEYFKAFLYLAGDKCVGLCLAERIRHAQKVVGMDKSKSTEEGRPAMGSTCLKSDCSAEPALLGISRIWVSRSHRRKGIAGTLLECARRNFFFGLDVPKKMVAFSQPTESGGCLAQKWFEEEAGWHVYTGDH